jgi:hypothetical protein
MRTSDAPVPVEVASRAPETRQERASIASFFGFGPKADAKPDAVETATPAPIPAPAAGRTPSPAPVQAPAPAATEPTSTVAAPDNQTKRKGWWQKGAEG